jgi:hypothetical protein
VVANALKWAGQRFNWTENAKALCRDLECCKYHGTEAQKLEDGLKKWGRDAFTVRYRTEKLSLKAIRDEVSKGRAIVCDFSWPKKFWEKKRKNEDGHYALLIDILYDPITGTEYFGMVNLGCIRENLAVEYITSKTFRRLCLRRNKSDNFWILRKKDRKGGN